MTRNQRRRNQKEGRIFRALMIRNGQRHMLATQTTNTSAIDHHGYIFALARMFRSGRPVYELRVTQPRPRY